MVVGDQSAYISRRCAVVDDKGMIELLNAPYRGCEVAIGYREGEGSAMGQFRCISSYLEEALA